jgi:hypothetical protein
MSATDASERATSVSAARTASCEIDEALEVEWLW